MEVSNDSTVLYNRLRICEIFARLNGESQAEAVAMAKEKCFIEWGK